MVDTPFIRFISSLTVNSVWTGVKLIYLVAFLIYALFALVIVTQVIQMKKSATFGLESLIEPVVWAHLMVAILAFVLALMLL